MQTHPQHAVSSTVRNIVAPVAMIVLSAHLALAAPQADPGSQTAMQAQQASQQSIQASQQAQQSAQQANAQATADAQTAPLAQTGSPLPPHDKPTPFPVSPNAPVPAQIAAAHTVFLTDAGAAPNFPIDENTAYQNIYAALQAWGRYQLVTSPDQADLIFSLRDVSPITDVVGSDNGSYTLHTPAYKLTILDARTSTPIWTVTSPVYLAGKGQTYDRWVNLSVINLVSRVKVLAGQPLSPTETADLTTFPKTHFARAAWIIVGGTVALGVGGGLLLHHEFENSLSNMKQQQDTFCQQNNIPLSECAGG